MDAEDGNAPATKADIAVLAEALQAFRLEVQARFDQVRAEADNRYNDLVEYLADSQTDVRKALSHLSARESKAPSGD